MFTKATVIGVDLDAGVCKCRVEGSGATVLDVGFAKPLGGQDCSPSEGDCVALWFDGAQYWAMFILDRAGIRKGYRTPIANVVPSAQNIGAKTTMLGGSSRSTHYVDGKVPGDKVLATKGGALVAALLGGSVLLRASSLAKIFISKVDDLVKIFSRNFERFSEASSEVSVNPVGRPYEYKEVYDGQTNGRAGVASYKTMSGDVVAAEFAGIEWRNAGGAGLPSNVIHREAIDVPGGIRTHQRDLYRNGAMIEWTQAVYDADHNDYSTEVVGSSAWSRTVVWHTTASHEVSPHINVIESTPEHILLSCSDGAFVLELKADGTASLSGTTSLSVTVPSTTWTGDIGLTGNITVAEGGDVTVETPAGNISILKHVHPELGNDGANHVHVIKNPVPTPPTP